MSETDLNDLVCDYCGKGIYEEAKVVDKIPDNELEELIEDNGDLTWLKEMKKKGGGLVMHPSCFENTKIEECSVSEEVEKILVTENDF